MPDFYRAYRVLKNTQILGSTPWLALLRCFFLYLRYGASLYTVLRWSAGRFPQNMVVVSEEQSQIFSNLLLETDALAKKLGFLPRTRVALLFLNSSDFIVYLLACSRMEANILLLNSKSSSAELQQILEHQAQVLICEAGLHDLIPALNIPVFVNGQQINMARQAKPSQTGQKSTITILTSGSTGRVKAIKRYANIGLIDTLTYLLEEFRVEAEQKILLTVPMSHGHGLATLILALLTGSTLHIARQTNTKAILERLEKHRIDVLVLVPTILQRILEQPDSPTLKMIISGSAPLPPELVARTEQRFGEVLFNLYGTSETGLIAFASPADLQIAPNSVGKPLPNVRLRLEETILVQIGAEWFNTKDLGFLQDQRLFLLGRQDDIINCGGEKIHPEQLEQRILELSDVLDCAVKGIPDLEYGQAIKLVVVLKNGVTLESLKINLQQHLPRFLRPKEILVVSQLPKNALGKLQRQKI